MQFVNDSKQADEFCRRRFNEQKRIYVHYATKHSLMMFPDRKTVKVECIFAILTVCMNMQGIIKNSIWHRNIFHKSIEKETSSDINDT